MSLLSRFRSHFLVILMIWEFWGLDGLAVRNAKRGDSHESIRANRITSNLRFAICSPTKRDSQKRGPGSCSSGNPETIRENQAIHANLRIDSRIGPSKFVGAPADHKGCATQILALLLRPSGLQKSSFHLCAVASPLSNRRPSWSRARGPLHPTPAARHALNLHLLLLICFSA